MPIYRGHKVSYRNMPSDYELNEIKRQEKEHIRLVILERKRYEQKQKEKQKFYIENKKECCLIM